MYTYYIIHDSLIQVEFLGEDGGSLLREFWTILFREIKNSLFDDCCVPRNDVVALQVHATLISVHIIIMYVRLEVFCSYHRE